MRNLTILALSFLVIFPLAATAQEDFESLVKKARETVAALAGLRDRYPGHAQLARPRPS